MLTPAMFASLAVSPELAFEARVYRWLSEKSSRQWLPLLTQRVARKVDKP